MQMSKYKVLTVTTEYWRPKENYVQEILGGIGGKIADGDFIVLSEKALSTATGNIVDESPVQSGLTAKLIASFWMRIVWGYFLGTLCRFDTSLLQSLREYPLELGRRHKQVALNHAGLLQALLFGSEGGIDGSNLAYSYVSLPLENADHIASELHRKISVASGKSVFLMITDTDKTYSFRNFHFTPRPKPIRGIHSVGGVLAYLIGRMLCLRRRATPIAIAGGELHVETALNIAEAANRARGFGTGRTVWDMVKRFNVGLSAVSWEMLETAKHKPIAIVRRKR